MMARKLGAEERALWAKVIATVRPLRGAEPAEPFDPPPEKAEVPAIARGLPEPLPSRRRVAPRPLVGSTLDGTWDRRLGRGLVQPDMTVDLHGDNLATAYQRLDDSLEQAIALGMRVILLITGKPPGVGRLPVARGAIRGAVGDWLAASRHASNIAAVRSAHPRHGGAGALYIILRRPEARHRQKS